MGKRRASGVPHLSKTQSRENRKKAPIVKSKSERKAKSPSGITRTASRPIRRAMWLHFSGATTDPITGTKLNALGLPEGCEINRGKIVNAKVVNDRLGTLTFVAPLVVDGKVTQVATVDLGGTPEVVAKAA